MSDRQRVTVLVCGDALRGDDALALRAVANLDPRVAALAEIREIGQLSPDELLDAPEPVIVVDAVSGPPPGEVVDLPLADLAGLAAHAPSTSTHALPLATAVALGIRLRGSPPVGRFLGMGGAEYGLDAPLSDVVAQALPRLSTIIEGWILALARPAAPAVGETTPAGDHA